MSIKCPGNVQFYNGLSKFRTMTYSGQIQVIMFWTNTGQIIDKCVTNTGLSRLGTNSGHSYLSGIWPGNFTDKFQTSFFYRVIIKYLELYSLIG